MDDHHVGERAEGGEQDRGRIQQSRPEEAEHSRNEQEGGSVRFEFGEHHILFELVEINEKSETQVM